MNEFVFSDFTMEEKLSSWIIKIQCELLFALKFLFPISFPMQGYYNPFTPCKYHTVLSYNVCFLFLDPFLLYLVFR